MKIIIWNNDEGIDVGDSQLKGEFYSDPSVLPSIGDYVEVRFPKEDAYLEFEVVRRTWMTEGEVKLDVKGNIPENLYFNL